MMKLIIPKDKAKEIINNRISELNRSDFDHQAWTNVTNIALGKIFESSSQAQFEFSSIRYGSPTGVVLNSGRERATKILKSYIDLMDQGIFDEYLEKYRITEDELRKLRNDYSVLQLKCTALENQYLELVSQFEIVDKKNQALNSKNTTLITENTNLIQNEKRSSKYIHLDKAWTIFTALIIGLAVTIFRFERWDFLKLENLNLIQKSIIKSLTWGSIASFLLLIPFPKRIDLLIGVILTLLTALLTFIFNK